MSNVLITFQIKLLERSIDITCDGYSKVFVSLYVDSECTSKVVGMATYKEYDRR